MASSGSVLLRAATRVAAKQALGSSARKSGSSRYFAEVAARRQVSKEERAALRAARRERAATILQQQQEAGASSAAGGAHKQLLASKWIWYGALGVPTALLVWGFTDENSLPAKFADAIGLGAYLKDLSDEYAKPVHDKLLPDWAQMPNVPHDIPVPHTLVLDFENTLVSSTWDRKYGWRHAKRPGVDKFLLDMAQYYEIVLYSPSIETVDPAVTSLDKSGCIMHRLYRDATFFKDGVYVKDLKRLNRNINRIIVIDDDLAENAFYPENVIRVKPYDDPTNKSDNTLARITPLLIEIAREGYSDIPGLLSQYQGMDADEIADEHERRIDQYRAMREERMSTGLGGFAKMARKTVDFAPELEPREATFTPPTQQLTAKDLVGAAPPSASDTSGLVGFLNRRQEEKEENTKRKYEKWQEVMMRKQKERAERSGYIGKKHLNQAIEAVLNDPLPDAPRSVSFSVLRVPFFLEPHYDEEKPFIESNRDRLIKKWGGKAGWEAQKNRHDLKGRGEEAGIPHFNLDRLAANTMASHRLIQHVGKTYGLAVSEAMYDRLNEYYFVEGHSLNDRPRLAKVAATLLSELLEENCPSADQIFDFLNGDEGRKEIVEALDTLNHLGVHGIPKFIVEGQTVVDGAARAEVFVRIFREIEMRGETRGGPIFGDILGVPEEVVMQGSHFRDEAA